MKPKSRSFAVTRSVIRIVLFAVGSVVSACLILGVALWMYGDAPIDLSTPSSAPSSVATSVEHRGGRTFEHVTLLDPKIGQVGFMVSLPEALPRKPLPVVFVLGALGTGLHSISLIREPGPNAVVGYDWPPIDMKAGLGLIRSVRDQALLTPARVTALSRWVLAQRWADANRVTLAGFSLGAIAAPAVVHAMQTQGVHVRWIVLADGGAPIFTIVGSDESIGPLPLRWIAAFVAEALFHRVDPERHVSQLQGRFLIVSSADDTTIGAKASEHLARLTPPPKTIVRLPGGHVGTTGAKLERLDAAVSVTQRWLIAEGAIDSNSARK